MRMVLKDLIENQDVRRFYVGNQGWFDAMAAAALEELSRLDKIDFAIVLAREPRNQDPLLEGYPALLPPELAAVPPRVAIDLRNRWMLEHSDIVLTYVTRPIGGAEKFKEIALKKQKRVIELSDFNDKRYEKSPSVFF